MAKGMIENEIHLRVLSFSNKWYRKNWRIRKSSTVTMKIVYPHADDSRPIILAKEDSLTITNHLKLGE